MSFSRLIRFESDEGAVLYGDVSDEALLANIEGKSVTVINGDLQNGFSVSQSTAKVTKVSGEDILLRPVQLTTNIVAFAATIGAAFRLYWTELPSTRHRSQCMLLLDRSLDNGWLNANITQSSFLCHHIQ